MQLWQLSWIPFTAEFFQVKHLFICQFCKLIVNWMHCIVWPVSLGEGIPTFEQCKTKQIHQHQRWCKYLGLRYSELSLQLPATSGNWILPYWWKMLIRCWLKLWYTHKVMCKILQWRPKALSTLAGLAVGHYQLLKFSLLKHCYQIIAFYYFHHFSSCPPLPFPPCLLERVMGTVFASSSAQGGKGSGGHGRKWVGDNN